MAELKTKATQQDPKDFLSTIEPEQKRLDSFSLLKIFEKVTGEKAVMWGTSIVGFGTYHYKSEKSSQEGDWPLVGFSPRKESLTLYLMAADIQLLKELGKHKASGGCVYVKKLSDVDEKVLALLLLTSYHYMKKLNTKKS